MSNNYQIYGDFSSEDARKALEPFFPDVKLTGWIIIGFEGSGASPLMSSNAGTEGMIIAGLSACLYAITAHELTGEPAQPMDVLEIPYRAGAKTVSLACEACGSIGWVRTAKDLICAGCSAVHSYDKIRAIINRKIGEAG